MTARNDLTTQATHPASLAKRMLQGAGIAFILISVFLLSAGDANPGWPRFWMIRPLVIVPFAGAMGGLFYYLMDPFRNQGGWKKVLAIVASVVVYLFGLWMGSVLGLDGTMWD